MFPINVLRVRNSPLHLYNIVSDKKWKTINNCPKIQDT